MTTTDVTRFEYDIPWLKLSDRDDLVAGCTPSRKWESRNEVTPKVWSSLDPLMVEAALELELVGSSESDSCVDTEFLYRLRWPF